MLMKQRLLIFILVVLALLVTVLCQDEECAHVIGGTAAEQSPGVWLISATVSSTETGWDKYADEWIVLLPDTDNIGGETDGVLGTRTLAHPHENEQPFTRSLSGVNIPEDVTTVVLAARDSDLGYCGQTYELTLGREMPETESPTVATSISGSKFNGTADTNSTGMSLFNETLVNATAHPVSPSANSTE